MVDILFLNAIKYKIIILRGIKVIITIKLFFVGIIEQYSMISILLYSWNPRKKRKLILYFNLKKMYCTLGIHCCNYLLLNILNITLKSINCKSRSCSVNHAFTNDVVNSQRTPQVI
jgi:hypothetical protein